MEVFKHLTGSKEAVEAYTDLVTSKEGNVLPEPIPHPKNSEMWRTIKVGDYPTTDLTEIDELEADWFDEPMNNLEK